jgi:hypothetical protein
MTQLSSAPLSAESAPQLKPVASCQLSALCTD